MSRRLRFANQKDMMNSFQKVFRSLMVLLIMILAWSVWQSAAQTNEAAGLAAGSKMADTNAIVAGTSAMHRTTEIVKIVAGG